MPVVPAKAGTQYAAAYREDTEYWVPGLASLARDDSRICYAISNFATSARMPSTTLRSPALSAVCGGTGSPTA
jgi:hypothetical protein